jgi:predicted esterase
VRTSAFLPLVTAFSFALGCDGAATTDSAGGSGGVAGQPSDGGGPPANGGAPEGGAPTTSTGGSTGEGGEGGLPSTGGDGGLDCTPSTTQWDEQPYCLTEVGPLELKVFVPDDGSDAPMQVAVYLHGDTANGYYEDWGFEALSAWATSNHVLFVAALAPNGCSWWRPVTSCSVDEYDDGSNATALQNALVAIGEAYDIYPDPVLFVGYSGGSTFLTRHFVPMYGDVRPGVIVANCGGVPPQPFDWTPTAETRAQVPLYYTFGSEDFMVEYIYPSVDEYTQMEFPVDVLEEPGYGHCDGDYDWDGRTIELWESYRITP